MATVVVTAFYLHTHLGSTALTLDANAGLVNAFTHKAYGELDSVLGDSAAAPYRYTGKERDETPGLGYFERRYLQSAFGTFISPDPLLNTVARFTDPQRWTPYRYARNNPINYVDPDGRETLFAIQQNINVKMLANGQITEQEYREASRAHEQTIDFIPVVGDIKGIAEAVADPSASNIVAAGIGFIPIGGDLAARAIKLAKGAGRFTEIGSGLSKAEARALIRSGDTGVSEG